MELVLLVPESYKNLLLPQTFLAVLLWSRVDLPVCL